MDATGKRDWSLIVAGIALVIVGVVFLFSPAVTLVTLAVVAGVGLLAVGAVDLVSYIRFREEWGLSGWPLAYAICDLLLGAVLLIHPLVSAAVLPWLVAIALAVYGVFEIVAAVRIRNGGTRMKVEMKSGSGVDVAFDTKDAWGWALFGGIAAIACALLFFFFPGTFAIVLAAFLIVRGVMLAVYGVDVPTAIGSSAAAHR